METKKSPRFVSLTKQMFFTDKFGNMVLYPEIIQTTDYDWLKTLPHNRLINKSAVRRLGKSVTDFGMLRVAVLICINYEYYIADGGHLIDDLKNRGLPVRAVIINVNTFEETMKIITTLNNSGRNWSLTQYIKGWSYFHKEYKTLIKFKQEFHLSYSLLAALLASTTQADAKKLVKDGNFEERADATRIKTLLNFIYNFEINTGVSMRHTHTSAGLASFIIKMGLDEYRTIENKLIIKVKEYDSKHPIPSFARQSDSEDLWTRLRMKI